MGGGLKQKTEFFPSLSDAAALRCELAVQR